MKKILLIRFSSFGDIVLTFWVCEFLKKNLSCEIHFFTKKKFKEIIELNPYVDYVHFIEDHENLVGLVGKVNGLLRQCDFDVVFDLHRNIRSFLIRRIIKFNNFFQKKLTHVYKIKKYRIKEFLLFFLKRKIYKKFFHENSLSKRNEVFRVVKQYLKFLNVKSLNEFELAGGANFFDLKKEKNLNQKKIICINADSQWIEKQWDFQNFNELAHFFLNKKYYVVWVGVKTNNQKVYGEDLRGKTNFNQLKDVLLNSSVVICNDSGVMHFAEWLNVPVVAIFGPTSTELGFKPFKPKSIVVEAELWCRPCSKSGNKCFRLSTNKRLCLKKISVEEVKQKVEEILMS
jgi:heptosyltransferase-2